MKYPQKAGEYYIFQDGNRVLTSLEWSPNGGWIFKGSKLDGRAPNNIGEYDWMPVYTTGSGQKLVVHYDCEGEYCTIHNPSMDWPTHWRDDLYMMEYACPCGVGFPAPEDKKSAGHAFGTCGNKDCYKKYKEALKKVANA